MLILYTETFSLMLLKDGLFSFPLGVDWMVAMVVMLCTILMIEFGDTINALMNI